MKRVPVLQVPERDCCPIQYASSLQPLLVLKLRSKRCQWQTSRNFYKDLKTVLLSMSTLLASSSNVIDFLFIVRLLMHITFPIINSVKSVSIGIIKLLTNLTLFSSTRSLKHVLSDCLNGTEIVILNKLPSLGKSI